MNKILLLTTLTLLLSIAQLGYSRGFVNGVDIGTLPGYHGPVIDSQERAFIKSQHKRDDGELEMMRFDLDRSVNMNTPIANSAHQNKDGSIDLK